MQTAGGAASGGEIPVVIPAYQPGSSLATLVPELLRNGVEAVVVVNDGSGPGFEDCFEKLASIRGVIVVHHAVNLGKGAALKTGLNRALVRFPSCRGAVTADADGQHHLEDILRVRTALSESPGALVLGVRTFGDGVPWRSRTGNNLTRALMRLLVGQNLSDTQTGLRGIPSFLIPHLLRVPSSGYEFELDMLIACKHQGFAIVEVPIRTIYLDNNRGSHFHPVFDSMRIYFLLLRFSALSLLTAALDNAVFAAVYTATASIGGSQVASRSVAMIFNYLGARRVVFQSRQKHAVVLPKYAFLVVLNGLLSYALIQFLHSRAGFAAVPAKLLAESLLFIANFAIQRDFVFTKRDTAGQATDWNRYYTAVPFTAKLTRRFSAAALSGAIRRHAVPSDGGPISIVEIGGANSCFVDAILARVRCRSYDVVDTNRHGLSLLEKRLGKTGLIRLHEKSVFDLWLDEQADLVFSAGLVEHFDPAGTRKAVLAHFDVLRPEGVAIITFPTPTFLYRGVRRLLETAGMWAFPDERPLEPAEVMDAVAECASILEHRTIWPLLLTQHVVVARKTPACPPRPQA